MPELPEVEAARRAAHTVAVGRRIVDAYVADDPIVFEGVAPARFRRALVGRRVKAVRRHGKHLWLELDRRPWPCLHFGMTGGIHVPAGRAVGSCPTDDVNRSDWPPRFTKLHLRFAGGGELALADGRRLGRIRLRQDPPTEPPINALGFDAWQAMPTAATLPRDAPRAEVADQGGAARPVLRGGHRQLDRRRGALPGRDRTQAPRQHALRRGGRAAADPDPVRDRRGGAGGI